MADRHSQDICDNWDPSSINYDDEEANQIALDKAIQVLNDAGMLKQPVTSEPWLQWLDGHDWDEYYEA